MPYPLLSLLNALAAQGLPARISWPDPETYDPPTDNLPPGADPDPDGGTLWLGDVRVRQLYQDEPIFEILVDGPPRVVHGVNRAAQEIRKFHNMERP